MAVRDWSAREGLPRIHTTRQAGRKRRPKRKERAVTRALRPPDADRLVACAPEGRPRRVVRLLLWTGMHPAVLAQPKRFDLRVSRGDLTWHRPKTLKRCAFRVPAELEEAVTTLLANDLGKSVRTYREDIYRAARAAGLDDVSPLTLRHTAACNLLRRGWPAEAVQRALQCSSKVLWDHYAQVKGEELAEIPAAPPPEGKGGD